ncbi:hypothetical protein DFH07DRAFT_966165 [Mycena maculata]|uniref:Uncharacterized protein n=1 Tax=Mycena maculata TaxID=230809 RepID=A0AAD7IB52_9AGAR|nr:hypothetical protein DFH07DRAFT_966165 [Mycena maculata]
MSPTSLFADYYFSPRPLASGTDPELYRLFPTSSKTRLPVKGKVFNRVIQVWLENTDFERGILLTNYNSLTHPSEPNYVGAISPACIDDNMYRIPSNISCVVDLLEDKGISWAMELLLLFPQWSEFGPASLPPSNDSKLTLTFHFSYTAPNYASPSSAPVHILRPQLRKYNPFAIYDAVSQDRECVKRIRTFNDVNGTAAAGFRDGSDFIPPFSTPYSYVNDAHNTIIDFAASFLEYWLVRLTRGAVPENLRGMTDDTFTQTTPRSAPSRSTGTSRVLGGMTQIRTFSLLTYISISPDAPRSALSNVFSFVAQKTGYTNVHISASQVPMFDFTGSRCTECIHPLHSSPSPVNMLALNTTTPWQMSPETTSEKNIISCADAASP